MGGLLGECRNAVEGDDAETGRNEPERRAANRNGSATQSKRCRCGEARLEAFARKRLRSGRLGYQHLFEPEYLGKSAPRLYKRMRELIEAARLSAPSRPVGDA